MKSATEVKKAETTLEKIGRRAATATVMMLAFMAIMYAGHLYVAAMVVMIQAMLFRELVNVRYHKYRNEEWYKSQSKEMPLFRTLQWLWFIVAIYTVYGDFVHHFCMEHHEMVILRVFMRYHSFAAFSLYSCAFALSIITLRADLLKYQIGQLTWTIASLCLVIGQMKFVAHNIYNGMFWFFYPCWLVIQNDCWAYFWGMLLGRKLIKRQFWSLSPNKTWEGFIGAIVCTMAVGWFSAGILAQYQYMVCPVQELTFFSGALSCEPPRVFQSTVLHFPAFEADAIIAQVTGQTEGTTFVPPGWRLSFEARPIQIHGVVLALFASVVGPFGGFLASAIKRAYSIKDFDSFLPGHGGLMDRMDCQFLMHFVTYIHYAAFVSSGPSVNALLASALTLSVVDQQRLLELLQQHLSAR